MVVQTRTIFTNAVRRYRPTAWSHWITVVVVYSVAGSLSMLLTRFVLNSVFQLEGGLISGPWSYRIAYLLFGPPSYSVTLIAAGTVFGKHAYFRHRVLRTWGRLIPSRWRARTTSSS